MAIVDNLKTIQDYTNAQQAQQQALQSGAVDALSKRNIYATQVLSGASATGDQNAYDQARAHLAQNGIDISTWAPDVASGAKQAQAARLAQSPLGSLLNAGLKEQSNAIQLAPQTGQITPTAMGMGGILGVLNGGGGAPASQSPQAPSWNNPDAPALPAQQNRQAPAQPQESPTPAYVVPSPAPVQSGGFVAPQQMPNEPLPTYRERINQAFQQYKETPAAVRQKEAASTQGKTDVGNIEAANKAQELTDRLTKNLNAMSKLNDSVPQSGFFPASSHAYLDRALQANGIGNGSSATAYDQWNQIDNQQVLSEIQQFIASGGANARVNQTLEKIAKAASSISASGSPATRKAEIQNALAELANKNTGGQNLVRANNGKAAAPYTDIPVTVPDDGIVQKATESAPNIPVKGDVVGDYLFMGGNLNDKANYKKIR